MSCIGLGDDTVRDFSILLAKTEQKSNNNYDSQIEENRKFMLLIGLGLDVLHFSYELKTGLMMRKYNVYRSNQNTNLSEIFKSLPIFQIL